MSYESPQQDTYPPANNSYAEAGGVLYAPPLGVDSLAPLESQPLYPLDGMQPLDPSTGILSAQQMMPPPLTAASEINAGPTGSMLACSSDVIHGMTPPLTATVGPSEPQRPGVGSSASQDLVLIPLCRKGDRVGIERQLQAGASLFEVDVEGNTPLHVAAEAPRNEIATVQCLLENGANVNALNYIGASPLHYVCLRKSNHRGIANILLENGAQINQQTVAGKTALHFACENSLPELVEVLCLFGADCNFADHDGNMPGHLTVMREGGRDTVKKEILQHLARVYAEHNQLPISFAYANMQTMTATHLACQNGYIRCVQYFYDNGVDLSVVNQKGQNGIHLACLHNRAEVLQLLLSVYPSAVDLVDGEGNTPLHHCASVGSLDCALLLLKMDANTTLRNVHKKTAFDLAKIQGTDLNNTHNPELLQVLKDAKKGGTCRQS